MNAELVPARTLVSDVLILIKFRIGSMVVLGTFVGYVLGIGQAIDPISIFHVLFATFLTASGTGVLNQFMERERDGLMGRTADRPLPAGRIAPEMACWFGLILCGMGIVYLGVLVNDLTALMGALTVGIYLLLYTPLKPKTAHNTAVGAIAGALPPVGGWTAATGVLSGEALALFGILFCGNFPISCPLHGFTEKITHGVDFACCQSKIRKATEPPIKWCSTLWFCCRAA